MKIIFALRNKYKKDTLTILLFEEFPCRQDKRFFRSLAEAESVPMCL
jgi:hypothetical protein